MPGGQNIEPISRRRLAEDYFENLHAAYRSMRDAFAVRAGAGFTQGQLAARIGADEGLISRRFKGEENMTLKTLSAMASGLDCGLVIEFKPLETYDSSNYFDSNDWKFDAKPSTDPAPSPPVNAGEVDGFSILHVEAV